MGSDKAFSELGGRTLLARALELGRSVSGNVSIVGDAASFANFATVVPDIYPAHGPLGGIHAALLNSKTDLNLMIGVDLPFLEARLLKYVIAHAESSSAVVTVPLIGARYQPLCAVYRREFAPLADRALARQQNKIDALFSGISLRILDETELASAGWNANHFRNLNTPDDFKAAQQELDSPAQHL